VPTAQVAAELPVERQTVKRRLDDFAEAWRAASLASAAGCSRAIGAAGERFVDGD